MNKQKFKEKHELHSLKYVSKRVSYFTVGTSSNITVKIMSMPF